MGAYRKDIAGGSAAVVAAVAAVDAFHTADRATTVVAVASLMEPGRSVYDWRNT